MAPRTPFRAGAGGEGDPGDAVGEWRQSRGGFSGRQGWRKLRGGDGGGRKRGHGGGVVAQTVTGAEPPRGQLLAGGKGKRQKKERLRRHTGRAEVWGAGDSPKVNCTSSCKGAGR